MNILERLKTSLACGFTEEQIEFRVKSMTEAHAEETKKAESLLSQFPSIAAVVKRWLAQLRPLQMTSVTFHFRALSELIAKLATFVPFVKKYIPVEVRLFVSI